MNDLFHRFLKDAFRIPIIMM